MHLELKKTRGSKIFYIVVRMVEMFWLGFFGHQSGNSTGNIDQFYHKNSQFPFAVTTFRVSKSKLRHPRLGKDLDVRTIEVVLLLPSEQLQIQVVLLLPGWLTTDVYNKYRCLSFSGRVITDL